MIKVFTLAELDIPTATTRVQLTDTPTNVLSVTIQADTANTNGVWVGDISVAATRGLRLAPGQSVTFSAETTGRHGEEFDMSDIYVDTDANGNDVWISYVKRK